jgi:hypothetical protein
MSLRIRTTGEVLCAAMHPELPGDTYVHDGVSYVLTVERRLLVTEPMVLPSGVGLGGHGAHGRWWWRDNVPPRAVIQSFDMEGR